MGRAPVQGSDGIEDALLRLLAEHAASATPCALATVVRTEAPTSAHPGDKAVITADGTLHGWIGGSCSEPLVRREALLAIADGLPRLVRIRPDPTVSETRSGNELTVATTCPSGGALDIFIDPQLPKPLLLVFGGSPAARMLVRLGADVGYRAVAVHTSATASDFPGADKVVDDLAAVTSLPASTDSWVVVATMGHYDEEALTAALQLSDADIALVASERRAKAVFAALRGQGVAESQIERVRTPAGGRRGRGGTQEEIALHALDEVVELRRARLDAARTLQPSAVVGFVTDPVCGMTVDVNDSRHQREWQGRTFHFCCAACAESFDAEPERFAAAVR